MSYETIVGLEVHVELSTGSKIFCGCSTAFGGEPNSRVCPVCSGLPGSLPVLNRSVVDYAIRAGLALNCQLTHTNQFDRKNYFYPDLPKAYQVSQLYLPICRNGYLDIETESGEKRIGIHEIHMEEDAGKLIHDPWEDCTLVDYNRCGIPLLEIVSEPDFRSAGEVIAYLEKLREILVYLDISDCKMQEGSMRADINLSVRPAGQAEFGTRTEMKNMNSLKAIHRAVIFESQRQIEALEKGEKIIQQTRRWDDNKDASFAMRSKENAQDYRYFPEPDLPPITIDTQWVEQIKASMPELADKKRQRYQSEFGLSAYDAKVLTSARELAALFEETAQICGEPKEVANMIMVELMRLLSDHQVLPEDLHMAPEKLAALIKLVLAGKINRNTGKAVLEAIFLNNVDPEQYVIEKGLLMVNDDKLLSDTVDRILSDNEQSVKDYKSGKEKAFGFLVGQTMKALKGQANPQAVNQILKEKLNGE